MSPAIWIFIAIAACAAGVYGGYAYSKSKLEIKVGRVVCQGTAG
jgi:hypothetical protein